jgi:hypothetical protein
VRGLRLARWLEVMEAVREARADEARERLREAAFLGWQMSLLWSEKPMTFAQWLDGLGLGDQRQAPPARESAAEVVRRIEERVRDARRRGVRYVKQTGQSAATQ